jgi:hypothetical protein
VGRGRVPGIRGAGEQPQSQAKQKQKQKQKQNRIFRERTSTRKNQEWQANKRGMEEGVRRPAKQLA